MFVTLIICSVQSVAADFVDEWDSEYKIYLHAEVRNAQGQLVSISEGSIGTLLPHEITDRTFNEKLGKIEIVTIDNIKYEKVQYAFSPTLEQRTEKTYPIFEEFPIEYVVEEDARAQMNEDIRDYYRWVIHYCATFKGHVYTCIPVFQAFTVVELVTHTDVVTHQWTILRVLN